MKKILLSREKQNIYDFFQDKRANKQNKTGFFLWHAHIGLTKQPAPSAPYAPEDVSTIVL